MHRFITWFVLLFIGALLLGQAPRLSNAKTFLDLERKSAGTKAKYAVIFDAGSSGTRIKVYKITLAHNPLQVSDVQQVPVPKPDKSKPGLSTFADDVESIRGYLRPLINGALKVVPKENHQSTPIRLFATAGMRLLKKDKIDKILNKVDDLLSNKEFCPFLYKRGYSKVITGQDEAVYMWVTVNFLKGSFSGASSGTTYGTIDLGGASAQNAFKVANRKSKLPVLELVIAGKKYRVFAHSYLGYGEAEARKTFLQVIVKKSIKTKKFRTDGEKVYSPCHNYGFNTSVTVDGKDYVVRGAFKNAKLCQRYLKSIFFCRTCAFKDQPRLSGDFYSSSLFSYAFRETGCVVQKDDEVVTIDKIEEIANSHCSKSVFRLDIKKDYLAYARCFHLNYIEVMLVNGYRVNRKFVLHNAQKLNGFDLNWSLGAVLMTNHFLG